MIVIIDYGMGNIGSILNMLRRLGVQAMTSANASDILSADMLILPGVGSFDTGMAHLHKAGLIPVLNDKVIAHKTPVLGICLGMQLLTRTSEEGTLPGLGWIDGKTIRFTFGQEHPGLRIPHMGWNTVTFRDGTVFSGSYASEPRFYFVHSYHVVCDRDENVAGTTIYGYPFASAIQRDNVCGVQFHPEKSHRFGMTLLDTFVGTGRLC